MGGLLIALAPAVSQSAVVYRMSGTGCQPLNHNFDYAFEYNPGEGYSQPGSAGTLAGMTCMLPTSDATFSASTLDQVNVRYHVDGTGTVMGWLFFHDYDSPDFVECDFEQDSAVSGYGMLTLEKSCSGYDSTWGVTLAISAGSLTTSEALSIKLVSVYE